MNAPGFSRWKALLNAAVFMLSAVSALALPWNALGQQAERGAGSPLTVNPEGEIRLGSLEVHPSVQYQLIFDDNIFKERNNTVFDIINKFTPSLGLRLPIAGARHEINLYSEGRIWRFDDRDQEDHEDFLVLGQGTFRPGDRLELNGRASYEDTEDPSSSEQQSTTGPRTPRTQLIGAGGGKWTVSPKTRLSLAGDYTQDRYQKAANDRLDKDTGGVTLEGFYQVLPKTSVVLSYRASTTDFTNRLATDSNDDSITHQILAGLDFDPTAKLSGRAAAGFSVRSFDASGRDDESSFSIGVDLTWRPLARTTLGLFVERGFADTSTEGQFAITRTTVRATGRQALTEKLAVDASFSSVLDEFVDSSRDDLTVTAGGGVSYQLIRWFSLGVRYEFEKKDSDVNANDYEDNKVTLTFAARF